MSEGSQTRRTLSGFAWMVLTLVLAAGCEQIPSPRANTAPIHLPKPAPQSADGPPALETDPTGQSALLPRLPESQTPPTEPSSVATATPLLDDALARAEALKRIELSSTKSTEPVSKEPPPAETRPAPQHPEPPSPTRLVATTATVTSNVAANPTKPSTEPSKPIDLDPPKTMPAPHNCWIEGIEQLRTIAKDRQSATDQPSPSWSLRARLVDVLAQTEDGDSPERPAWRTVWTAFAVAGSHDPADLRSRSQEIREAVTALEEQTPLEINELRLCQKVSGFGGFEPMDASACRAGQTVIVYCEITGIRFMQFGDAFHSRLASRVEILPAEGQDPVWKQSLGSAEDVCRRRRRDYFVNYRLTLPDHLPPGTYTLRLTQDDEIAGCSTSASTPITIQP